MYNKSLTYSERVLRASKSYMNDIKSTECMNFCNDMSYWARMSCINWQVEIEDMLDLTNKSEKS